MRFTAGLPIIGSCWPSIIRLTGTPRPSRHSEEWSRVVCLFELNIVYLRAIKAGVTDDDITQVEGISPSDVVAASSFDRVQENAAITISSKPLSADISLSNAT